MSTAPNFLIFCCDQLRADCLGCEGHELAVTPNINSIAEGGVRFSRAYVQNPLCSPSRATMITGRYPRSHGCLCNGTPLPEDEITLPAVLGEAGYATCATGKVHLRPHEVSLEDHTWIQEYEGDGPYYGFQQVHLSDDYKLGGYLRWIDEQHPEWSDEARDIEDGRSRSGSTEAWHSRLPAELHQSSWIADRAIEFIGEADEQPFFLWCSFVDPHHPFSPPAPYSEMYERAAIPVPEMVDLSAFGPHWAARQQASAGRSSEEWREIIALYLGMISLIDDCVGRVLATLEEQGLAENTVVGFVNDHGELLGDHGLLLKGPFLLESMIRQVQLWRGPGVRVGATDDGLAESVDIAPTVLDLAGVAAPEGMQGESLARRLAGEAPGKEAALVQFSPWTAYDGGRFPGGPERMHLNALVTDEHKLVHYAAQPFGELFDLREDPGELRNLYDDPGRRALRGELTEQLLDCLGETVDPLPPRTARY